MGTVPKGMRIRSLLVLGAILRYIYGILLPDVTMNILLNIDDQFSQLFKAAIFQSKAGEQYHVQLCVHAETG